MAIDKVTSAGLTEDIITGQTAETSVATDDLILLSDTSASGALKKMTRANFVSGVGETNTPLFRAYIASTDQTIPNNSWTKVAFGAETFDPQSTYDTSNYRFTPGVAGYFFINAQVTSANTADFNGFKLRVYKNGSAIAGMQVRHTYADSITISTMDLSDDNDYYEIYVYQNSGGNSDIRNIDMDNSFQAFKVSS